MLLSYFLFLFILPAVTPAPFTRPQAAQTSQDHWWSHLIESVGRALGMRGIKHGGSFAIDLGMPQTGDGWFWNLNGWTLAESELSVVVSRCIDISSSDVAQSSLVTTGPGANSDIHNTSRALRVPHRHLSGSPRPPPTA
jgi:hypothetical protein